MYLGVRFIVLDATFNNISVVAVSFIGAMYLGEDNRDETLLTVPVQTFLS
jgi:hypothetical protein